MKRFALIGNPNCGKTTLFNALTGSTAHVGNWPGVTVDKKDGYYKKLEENIAIIDLPGIYSMSPYTSEEVISRNYILDQNPDCIINIVDVTNLERNLYLTTQIMEMDVPMVVALNMMDVLKKNGDSIDVKALEKSLGVPVILISAQKENGIDELMNIAYKESQNKRKGKSVLEDSFINKYINRMLNRYLEKGVSCPLFHAIKYIENDEIELSLNPDFSNNVSNDMYECNLDSNIDLEATIADLRYKYISKNYSVHKMKNEKKQMSTSDKIDKVLTNKWAGIPIFLIVLFLIFHLTFSENILYLGNIIPSFKTWCASEGGLAKEIFFSSDGLNSIGVILQNALGALTDYITSIVGDALSSQAPWVSGLICDGILAGVFSVLSFLPQILVLFLFFSILEDSGYMARIAFILDRIFRKFGLSGRAFMPMIMGFGCSVPAIINTRTLASDAEREATIRIIPFFSCGAKLPILLGVSGGIVALFGFSNIDLITYSMYLCGIIIAICAVLIMRHTEMRGDSAPFIMELPAYHMPQFKALMIHLWDKLKHFVKKSFTIILASTIVIWFLQSFTWNMQYIENASITDIANTKFDEMIEDNDFMMNVISLDDSFVDEDGNFDASLTDIMECYNEASDIDKTKFEEVLKPLFVSSIIEYQNITQTEGYVDTSNSILASVGKVIQPVFTPIGFGSQLNQNGWIFGVSALTGLIAKENVIATFSVLAQCTTNVYELDYTTYMDLYCVNEFSSTNPEESVIQMAKNTGIVNNNKGYAILISFILFNMTTIPCFAAVATAKGELIYKKKFAKTLLFWIFTSYMASMAAYLVLTWWYLLFVYAALALLVWLGIRLYNKRLNEKEI